MFAFAGEGGSDQPRRWRLLRQRKTEHIHSQPIGELLQQYLLAVVEADRVAIPEWFGGELNDGHFLTRADAVLLLQPHGDPVEMQTRARRNADGGQRLRHVFSNPHPLTLEPAFDPRPDTGARRSWRGPFEGFQIGDGSQPFRAGVKFVNEQLLAFVGQAALDAMQRVITHISYLPGKN